LKAVLFFSEVANHPFHCPLGIIDPRAHTNDLGDDVKECMQALSTEVDTISTLLIIQLLVFFDKLDKELVGFAELLTSNTALMDKPYGLDKFAVILPVFVR
jgi:hypothetical protein